MQRRRPCEPKAKQSRDSAFAGLLRFARNDEAARGLTRLFVARRYATGRPHDGKLIAGALVLPCALGRSGVTHSKREGDGATPAGRHALLYFLLRRGRLPSPRAPHRFIRKDDIWCDDPASFFYNCPLRAPSRVRHEELWRDDGLYDAIGALGCNMRPRVRGKGSAIFFHVATDDLGPTAGCVALRRSDMARLLPQLACGATLTIV